LPLDSTEEEFNKRTMQNIFQASMPSNNHIVVEC